MKTIPGSRGHQYVAMASIFLILLAFIAGIVGCEGEGGQSYTLTISSTTGGWVAEPGEAGPYIYEEGTVVDLVAEAEEGYYFVKWTGDVDTVDDADAAETTITINDNYSITANFVPDGAESVWDWYDLDAIRNNLDGAYVLMNDLDSAAAGYEQLASETANEGKGWEPIGTLDEPFNGSFDGREYKIEGAYINRYMSGIVGLFDTVWCEGVIRNIGVVNVTVTGDGWVGGLAGFNSGGTISNCYATGSVAGPEEVGGLVGVNDGTVSNCYAVVSVVGGLYAVGGLVGMGHGTVSNSSSSGSVIGEADIGGLVGQNLGGNVSNSYSTCTVTGELTVGGLVAWNYEGTVSNSYSTGSVTGNSSIGGLLGANEGNVSNSYSIGIVNGASNVGGLVGDNTGTVNNSFWDIETSGQATSAGGTGKTTTQMLCINTFTGATWDIVAVANPSTRNLSYIWNIVDDETYPFLSWEPVS